MSQENVEIVRAFVDAWNRNPEPRLCGWHPSRTRAVGPQHGVFRRDQMRGFWDEFVEGWEAVRIEADELIGADEQVVVPLTAYTQGREALEAAGLRE